jgi:hypothetical protein
MTNNNTTKGNEMTTITIGLINGEIIEATRYVEHTTGIYLPDHPDYTYIHYDKILGIAKETTD